MTALLQISLNFSALGIPACASNKQQCCRSLNSTKPFKSYSLLRLKIGAFHRSRFSFGVSRKRLQFSKDTWGKDENLRGIDALKKKRRMVWVKFNEGFNKFNGIGGGSGGGGGGKDDGTTARVLGNLALAIFLTYLSMTGQLGWVLDAIVSVWILVVLLPILGLGAFIWWAGQDIVQGSCPNCGNDFQIFKSMVNDELQLCPFCSQPFSVIDDKFVSEPVKFSNQSTASGEAFSDFPKKKGKKPSVAVVDIEAEVKDAE